VIAAKVVAVLNTVHKVVHPHPHQPLKPTQHLTL